MSYEMMTLDEFQKDPISRRTNMDHTILLSARIKCKLATIYSEWNVVYMATMCDYVRQCYTSLSWVIPMRGILLKAKNN